MYAIIPLDAETAPRFERLAPYHVRPLLAELRVLPRVELHGAMLMGEPIGLAVLVRDVPGVQDGRVIRSRNARLLSLTVARSYRRIGVGSALLQSIESAAIESGGDEVAFSYAFAGEQLRASEAFFRKAGWSEPAMTMLHCRADRAMLNAPLMQDARELPADYEICDWIDVTPAERNAIAARQAETEWYPPDLDPFHYERGLELLNSLALRYRGAVVGWLLTARTAPTTIHYRCLWVRPDLARLGRGLAMIVEAIRRQQKVWDVIAPDTGHGEWGTPATLPAMVRFIRRHLAPYTEVTERRVVRRTLASSPPPTPTPGTEGRRSGATSDDVSVVPALTREECESIRADVLGLREHWVRRDLAPRFHTLGRSAQLDGGSSAEEFAAMAQRSNELLRTRFAPLYDTLVAALSRALHTEVRFREHLPRPGFLILGDEPGATLPIAAVRCDYPPLSLSRGASWPAAPLSFVLTVASETDAPTCAMRLWPLDAETTVGLDTDEIDRLLDRVPSTPYPTAVGELLVFPALVYHQPPPLTRGVSSQRITLEGRAFRTETSWELYW